MHFYISWNVPFFSLSLSSSISHSSWMDERGRYESMYTDCVPIV